MKITFVLMLALISLKSYAIDSDKCSAMLNNGLWKKYKYAGIGESYYKACTNGTKKDGSSTATSDGTTEGTTAISDPKYTSNVWTSESQSTSSWGACSMFADVKRLKEDRELYIAQNEPEVLIDLARGSGEHLKVLAFYSACLPSAYNELGQKLQYQISNNNEGFTSKSISNDIDKVITTSKTLRELCLTNI